MFKKPQSQHSRWKKAAYKDCKVREVTLSKNKSLWDSCKITVTFTSRGYSRAQLGRVLEPVNSVLR